MISEAFNENDIIYKKIIAEGVFNGESKYFAIQSKIMNESLSTHGLDGKKIITGNLIFSNLYKKSHKKIRLIRNYSEGFYKFTIFRS